MVVSANGGRHDISLFHFFGDHMTYQATSRQEKVRTTSHHFLIRALSESIARQMGYDGTADPGYQQCCIDIARSGSPDGGFEGFITYGETREFMDSVRPLARAFYTAMSQRCLDTGEVECMLKGTRLYKLHDHMMCGEFEMCVKHWQECRLPASNDIGYTDEQVDILDQFYYAVSCDIVFDVATVEAGVMGG
jgi:hypothetical protein